MTLDDSKDIPSYSLAERAVENNFRGSLVRLKGSAIYFFSTAILLNSIVTDPNHDARVIWGIKVYCFSVNESVKLFVL